MYQFIWSWTVIIPIRFDRYGISIYRDALIYPYIHLFTRTATKEAETRGMEQQNRRSEVPHVRWIQASQHGARNTQYLFLLDGSL